MKRNNLIKTSLGLALSGLLLSACNSRKTTTLKLALEADNMTSISQPELMKIVIPYVLSIDDQVELSDIRITMEDKIARMEISHFTDNAELARKLSQQLTRPNKGLQIYETYENAELISSLAKLNEFIRQEDSLAAPVQPAPAKTPETLEEKFQAHSDSLKRATERQAPFRGLFQFNIYYNENRQPYAAPGAVIGFCQAKDTAAVVSMFRLGMEKGLLPKNLLVLTGPPSKGEEMRRVYALKLTPPFNKPALEGDLVASAQAQKDEYSSGSYVISLIFEPSFVEPWRDLTSKASPANGGMGKCLAMVFDNEVYSAPTVNGEIPNGNSQISGNFIRDEAEDLCMRLQAPRMPYTFRLASMELAPDSKK